MSKNNSNNFDFVNKKNNEKNEMIKKDIDEIVSKEKSNIHEKLDLILTYLETIMERLDTFEEKLNSQPKHEVKLKYSLLSQWKENIRNGCKYLEIVGIEEEAEFFCRKINDVCTIFNCPLNRLEEEQNVENIDGTNKK